MEPSLDQNRIVTLLSVHRRGISVSVVCFLIFVSFLVFSERLINYGSTFSINREDTVVDKSIQLELERVSKERDEIISSGILNSALRNRDLAQLLTLINAEVKKRNVDYIVITDRDGFTLARSDETAQQGDNVFQSTAQGKRVAQGQTVTAIVRTVKNPLATISKSLIFEQNRSIGSILVGENIDNAYANSFNKKYLKPREKIFYYTPQEGVIGDSMNNPEDTQLVNSYFSLGSDLVAQNLSGLSKEIKMGDTYYVVRNIVFPGLGVSPGGMFVFYPVRHEASSLFVASIAALCLLSFLLSYLYFHKPKYTLYIFLTIEILAFVIVYIIILNRLDQSAIEIKKSPYLIYNSVIMIDPETDVVGQASEKTIAIKVVTGGEVINAITAVVAYDPKAVEILDIKTDNSLCAPGLFVEKEIDKEKGEVRISCGISNPGFSGSIGTVAELLIRPVDLKQISFTFTKETQVLANDGLGTNVLRDATGGYYEVVRQKYAATDYVNPVPIFSSSHPNSNRWYNNKIIELSWPELYTGSYYFSMSDSATQTAEDSIYSTTTNKADITAHDGVHYFHIQAKSAEGTTGPMSDFKIMVDTTPPTPPVIRVSNQNVIKGDVVRIDFTSNDIASGLQTGFYVKMNEGTFLPVKPPFYIPFLNAGDYPLVIRVFDKANNFSDSSIIIHVSD